MKYMSSMIAILMAAQLHTAQAELRPLAADRPDATESPQTVDKGYFQLETSVVSYKKNRENHQTTTDWSFAETNFKYGIANNVDLQFVMTPYMTQKVGHGKQLASHSDIEVRAKINLWGNDGGKTAFGLLPYVKVPSGEFSNNEYEGGLIATYAMDFTSFNLGAQIELDSVYDDESKQHDWAWSHTLVLGRSLWGNISGYLEYIGDYTIKDDYNPYGSLGMTWLATPNFQWDVGGQFALTETGNDQLIFTGFTWRFK
ncbi:hypothetical protein AVO42_08620 [Thiomicrospira sp. XS5]|uniref:transporter n=1 Tax=Thiomicrospira sp. XS5 TaxID=1775636 RepID=UPI000747B300|nr:transporter [Thiomicrospira sp. XS5]KUJ75380.1 hypothetical protein AVO42_08620 [Thiomicrospira sp. XS5]